MPLCAAVHEVPLSKDRNRSSVADGYSAQPIAQPICAIRRFDADTPGPNYTPRVYPLTFWLRLLAFAACFSVRSFADF